MSNQKLTAKQDKFARLVAEGRTQADAYREAYNASNMKPETIQNNAYKLTLDNEISTRIEEYKKEFTKNLDIASQITVERLLKTSQKILKLALEQSDFTNSLKALDFQTKIKGLYAPTKNENKTEIIEKPDLSKLSKKDLESLEKTLTKI
jgi:hypothetical protein